MYPEITPLIRDTIKRRYEMIPYLYSLMLESHMTALPPQRWIGYGYESDPEVWTPEVMAGETQYWLGDTILVGGVYEPGKTTARMYLPTSGNPDQGYINLNAPYQHLPAGQWTEIKSELRDSIPLLARVGGAIVVGKDLQTRSPGDHRFPSHNVVEDDYRAVEIFPPKGDSGTTYSYTWYEDDGISARPEITTFKLRYSSTSEKVTVEFEKLGNFVPLWRDLGIILPVGDSRNVVMSGSGVACSRAQESRSRHGFTISTA
jgi:alpha-glucosidase (family GH31 glycosyl hydrolase)